ncbi:proline-rich protein 35 [Triplophysa rosa]|uniref:proline-rich protein 35 n=1 Tax=Triplophysa rosa TaxID=992332 RepID=UPI0025460DE9|nr:proline-rich protein 35 [Triplophysa rosa]XP_057183228.1 proline-rich protein 35 [Triplophysa rosa]
MSKDDCKVGCKHKERKPKKPHYIPRPWGKPYNYKCFQCPFTCMEKSHLYNHMKYSLCKNSLSLLIESDWPYRKGSPLHPDQLRLQQGNPHSRSPAKSQSERAIVPEEPPHSGSGDGETGNAEGETEREAEKDSEGMETKGSSADPAETCSRVGTKRSKQEADLVMADVFSLEEQLLRARSVEVESKLRHYRLSKSCLAGPAAMLSEQWRILSNQISNAKPKSDTIPSSLSCYPPPSSTGQLECSDTPGFNLSLLGVGYPLAPGLLSYLNPALGIPMASTATTTAHAQISPLPFLGSSAQLAHTQRHSDRHMISPHLYYPFLCEHSFGASSTTSSETGKMMKPAAVSLPPPSYPSKLNLWKVPALRPNQSSPAAWVSHTCSSPEPSIGVKERLWSREGRSGWQQDASTEQSLKRTATSLDSHGAPVEKKSTFEISLDSLKHSQKSSQLSVHSARSEAASLLHVSEQLEVRQRGMETETDPAAALLQDFTTLLHEYQNTEQRAASLPEQSHLWAHLGKIRSELSHIQQALERTARSNDGPLDLSVKKDPTRTTNVPGHGRETKDTANEKYTETEEEDEEEDDDSGQTVRDRQKCSLDTLMKLQSQGPAVKTEVMSDGGLTIRSNSTDVLWHSRTTKCEADSSVLLCSKTTNRPSSIQHMDTLCPTSPLTTTDTMV